MCFTSKCIESKMIDLKLFSSARKNWINIVGITMNLVCFMLSLKETQGKCIHAVLTLNTGWSINADKAWIMFNNCCEVLIQLHNYFGESSLWCSLQSLHLPPETKNTSFLTILNKNRLALQWQLNGSYLWHYKCYYLWYFCSLTFLKKRYFLDSCCSEFELVVKCTYCHFG